MEIELWWLLALPVFFALGWIAARVDIKQLVRESRALPRSYFRGLNFLLNEQPDKAIEAFLEAARVDTETIDLHFALGNLFRRRGETDRAIRVHQNLVDREGLSDEQRLQALSGLGQDYLKAGLLDRAEDIFLKLRNTTRDEEALRFLLEIYQQEKEWSKAIAIAEAMPGHADHLWQKEMAEFYCELAAVEMLHGRHDDARGLLEQAQQTHRKCVRATILLGDLAWSEGDGVRAIEHWSRIESQNPVYLALVAAKLMEVFHKQGQAEQGLQMLRGFLERHASLDLLDVVAQTELELHGAEQAYLLVRQEVRRNPTLLGLDRLLESQLMLAPPERRGDLELIKNLIHAHTRRVARYRCDNCGFKARQFYWRCPACGGWETYPPKRTEEFDLSP
ncbi:MAG: lipopolysaccharide assembly protein LapB [Proteobacteria bacterium]|nr:lipopolysaccharide assembly protein LapB [Pseudomonadota bacterium]HQR02998.1 lipopolysaccharide assembly protein LapB [Rhodocyclaceae bacterium]